MVESYSTVEIEPASAKNCGQLVDVPARNAKKPGPPMSLTIRWLRTP